MEILYHGEKTELETDFDPQEKELDEYTYEESEDTMELTDEDLIIIQEKAKYLEDTQDFSGGIL